MFVQKHVCDAAHLQVTCQWGLTPGQEARISSVVFAGTMFGSYAWGALSDAQGRRRGFAVPALFTFVCGIASALAPNYAVRAIGACLCRLGKELKG